MGTTAMALDIPRRHDEEESLVKVQDYLINQWLMGNGVLCGVTYDINSFSNRLGIDIEYVRVFMRGQIIVF